MIASLLLSSFLQVISAEMFMAVLVQKAPGAPSVECQLLISFRQLILC